MAEEQFPGRVKFIARFVRLGEIQSPVYGYYDFSHEKKVSKGERKAVYNKTKGEGAAQITISLSDAKEAIC